MSLKVFNARTIQTYIGYMVDHYGYDVLNEDYIWLQNLIDFNFRKLIPMMVLSFCVKKYETLPF
jgi:hypothetical protein